tara:strand:- start:109 stop:327 length:219 start_codon:yes stop_codon:yes gene_type:complete
MIKSNQFPLKFIFITFLFLILIFNLFYIYLNRSCSDLSPEQQCICYDLKNRIDSKNFENFKQSCEGYRIIDE